MHASAAQNAPVTKTCLHCGAVLPSNVRICSFCESTLAPAASAVSGEAWRSELSERLATYRARRKRSSPNEEQSQFAFEHVEEPPSPRPQVHVAVEDPEPHLEEHAEDFSFTIAIGRCAPSKSKGEMFIDVSQPTAIAVNEASEVSEALLPQPQERMGLYPVASIDERRIVGLIDAACILFACGGFLTLFGSLGGQFTFSKMSAAVYGISFAIVYLQYFALFTVFGGTTPGMMLRGVQVVDFSGEAPSPRQLLLRAAGYMLSAGTFFLGFLWAMWDEDELTWHDRISHTYLSSAEKLVDSQVDGVVHS